MLWPLQQSQLNNTNLVQCIHEPLKHHKNRMWTHQHLAMHSTRNEIIAPLPRIWKHAKTQCNCETTQHTIHRQTNADTKFPNDTNQKMQMFTTPQLWQLHHTRKIQNAVEHDVLTIVHSNNQPSTCIMKRRARTHHIMLTKSKMDSKNTKLQWTTSPSTTICNNAKQSHRCHSHHKVTWNTKHAINQTTFSTAKN